MNPFLIQTERKIVALRGKRGGYLMIAPSQEIEDYASLPPEVLLAAKAWATMLEEMGSPRAYWIILSEVTRHLHIHLYPRWPEDALRGVALFEERDNRPQPEWSFAHEAALRQWAADYEVEIIG